MARPYPDPNFNETIGLVKYANAVTHDYFTMLWVIAMAVVFFMLVKVKGYKTSDSFLAAFFLTMVMSSLLWAAGLLAGKAIIICLVLTIASAIWSALDD